MLSVDEFDEPQLIGQCLNRYGKAWHHASAFMIERSEKLNRFVDILPALSNDSLNISNHKQNLGVPPISLNDECFIQKSETKLAWEKLINRNRRNEVLHFEAIFTPEESTIDTNSEKPSIFEPIYKRSSIKKSKNHHKEHKPLTHLRRASSVPTPEASHRVVKFKVDDSISHASEELFPRFELPPHYPHLKKKNSGISMLLKKEIEEIQIEHKESLVALEVEITFFSEAISVLISPESKIKDAIRTVLKKMNEKFSCPLLEPSFFELCMVKNEGSDLLIALDSNELISSLKNFKFCLRKKLHTSLSLPH